MPTAVNFCFWIITTSNETTKWVGLTELEAVKMYRTTKNKQPDNIKQFGWGRIPSEFFND